MTQHTRSTALPELPDTITLHCTRLALQQAKKKHEKPRTFLCQQLIALLWQMPAPYRFHLFKIKTTIIINRDRYFGGSERSRRRFSIRADLLEGFGLQHNRLKGSRQKALFAFSTLLEEVIHYFDDHIGFSRSKPIKAALLADLALDLPMQKALFLFERRFNAVRQRGVKISITQYAPEEHPREMLVDILLIAHCLHGIGLSSSRIPPIMRAAFPHSWDLVAGFHALLAAQSGLSAHPPSSFFGRFGDNALAQKKPTPQQARALAKIIRATRPPRRSFANPPKQPAFEAA